MLPNNTSYRFTYNVYGEIDKVYFPTGGYERYVYGKIAPMEFMKAPYTEGNRGVTDRFVSADGTAASEAHWQYGVEYTPSTTGPYDVTMTSPDGTFTKRFLFAHPNNYGNQYLSAPYGFSDVRIGMAYEEDVYASQGGAMLRRRLTDWAVDSTAITIPSGGSVTAMRNPRVTKQVEILLDTGGNALTKTTTYGYDQDLNRTSTNEYDYDSSLTNATAQTAASGAIPSGTLVSIGEATYLVNDPAVDAATQTNYRNRNLISLPTSTRIKNGAQTIVAQGSISYDEVVTYPLLTYPSVSGWTDPGTSVRGNATSLGKWLDSSNTYLTTHAQYDQCGSVRNTWDAKGNQSQITYSSTYSYAYPTSTTSPIPDSSGQYGSNTALTTSSTYDSSTGLVASTTDANGQTTNYQYTDPVTSVAEPLNRLRKVARPDGGSTTYSYNDAPNSFYVRTQTAEDSSQTIDSYQVFDGLGRPSRSLLNVGGGSYSTTDIQYDNMGRVYKVSNPYLSTGLGSAIPSPGTWTTTNYDALGRVLTVTTPDGAAVNTAYSGNQVTVTDQAGKQRRSVSDALGRLTSVIEDPTVGGVNYQTNYTYDVLNNLRQVQQGTQNRYFMYDSLSRLIRAKNPEQDVNSSLTPALTDPVSANGSWSTGYTYDNNGNLLTRTDARNITATYGYDTLNRNTTITYSDSTPAVARGYDGSTNGKGRLSATATAQGVLTAIDSYDAVGRPTAQRQHFYYNGAWSPPFAVQRTYDLAGHVASQTYPSEHPVNYTYDQAGRLQSFTGYLGEGVQHTYSSSPQYDAGSRLQQEQYGTATPLYHKLHYNIRGQLYDVRLSTVAWATDDLNWNRGAIKLYFSSNYAQTSGTDNNGNVLRAETSVPTDDQISGWSMSQDNYAYDALNRLSSVSESQQAFGGSLSQVFVQAYSYDRFGNRTINQAQSSCVPPSACINMTQFTVDAATNRLYMPGDASHLRMSYDAAGNLVNDSYTAAGSTTGSPTRTYDAENRMTTSADNNQQTSGYAYDGDGHRVARSTGGNVTWQVYGMDGELLAEYPQGQATFIPHEEYGYRSGQLLVTATNGDELRLIRFINNAYEGTFKRDATTSELQTQMSTLATAGAQGSNQLLAAAQSMLRTMFNDTNYLNQNTSNQQYVTDLYNCYLERAPVTGDLNTLVGQLQNGTQTRASLLSAFETSSEFQVVVATLYGADINDDLRVQLYINRFYTGALGRAPDPNTELPQQTQAMENAAVQGQSQVQAAAQQMGIGIFQSPEYSLRNRTDQQFVTDLYEAFLQREPDTTGLNTWVGQVASQGRSAVLTQFAAASAAQQLAGTLYRELLWVTADQLGTPRMIAERTGSLAGVKRHDYLPFGEELNAGVGIRTQALGYVGDSVRQKFTQKERDVETGLDYFGARYYSSAQGRFTSVDPNNFQAHLTPYDPQSWNAYAYTNNNPLRGIDSDGRGWLGDLWQKIRNKVTYGRFETDAQLQQRVEADRNFLREQETNAGGDLYYRSTLDEPWRRLDIDNLNTHEVLFYAKSFRAALEKNTINELSSNQEDQASNLPPIGAGESTPRYSPSKDVRAVLKGDKDLSALSAEERETAAKFYEEAAQRTTGVNKEAGRLFNLERARYLREGGPTPPGTLNGFKARIGLP